MKTPVTFLAGALITLAFLQASRGEDVCLINNIIAKFINWSQDFESKQYWDEHCIELAQVADGKKTGPDGDLIIFKLLDKFSTKDEAQTKSIPVSNISFWRESEFGSEGLAAGDYVLIFSAQPPSKSIVLKKLAGNADSLLKTIKEISSIYKNAAPQELIANSDNKDDAVARFCLKELSRLVNASAISLSPRDQQKIGDVSEDPKRASTVRLLARGIVAGPAKEINAGKEYAWTQSALKKSEVNDWELLIGFINALADYGQFRKETIAFLSGLAADDSTLLPIRQAAWFAFNSDKLFHFENPDDCSYQIFDTCNTLLNDKSPMARSTGAGIIAHDIMCVDPARKNELLAKGKRLLMDAQRKETDSTVKTYIDQCLHHIESQK